jgi:exopolysaccharide production protein ExoZ
MASTSIIVIAFALLILGDYLRPPILRALLLGIPAMLIVACTLELERGGRIGFFRLWDDLGDASYSIYLTHIFIIAGLRILFRLGGIDASPLTGASFIILALLLSAAVGLLVFAFFERPAVKAAKQLLRV